MRKRESFLIIRSVVRDCQADRSDGCIIHHREREYPPRILSVKMKDPLESSSLAIVRRLAPVGKSSPSASRFTRRGWEIDANLGSVRSLASSFLATSGILL
jgi:hypothetical protein